MIAVPPSTSLPSVAVARPTVRARRFGIDTYQEPVIYMRRDCEVCRAEGFEAHTRLRVTAGDREIIATLNVTLDHFLEVDEAGLSEAAWRLLGVEEGDLMTVGHVEPLDSLSHVRAKMYGQTLNEAQLGAIVQDAVAGRYSDVELAAFLTATAGDRMTVEETVALTRAMTRAGDRLRWDAFPVVDKHCVGGLPGNRTTPIVVAIAAAEGLVIPKTSSRAITSPAGTADTMETLAPVTLSIEQMRRVVEREQGCVVWGGSVGLSPADETFIRIERALDVDSPGQMVASVLSKKAAAGSTHVVLDLPVGPTAKVRDFESARTLSRLLVACAEAVGLHLRVVTTDGRQPVGRGIGPALEARDILAVLRNEAAAPADLRMRSLELAGELLELGGKCAPGSGVRCAERVLAGGRAWDKFQAICEAQGGMRVPPVAPYTAEVTADRAGVVHAIDNRRLSRIAKLCGAPQAPAAGVTFLAPLGTQVRCGQPLLQLHAETPGELRYALDYARQNPATVAVTDG